MVFPHWGGQKSNPFLSLKSSERYLHWNSNFVNFRCCYFNLLWTSNKKLWRFFLNGGSFTSPKIILLKHKENNNKNICILCHILCFTHKFYNKWFDILPLQVSQTEFKLLWLHSFQTILCRNSMFLYPVFLLKLISNKFNEIWSYLCHMDLSLDDFSLYFVKACETLHNIILHLILDKLLL